MEILSVVMLLAVVGSFIYMAYDASRDRWTVPPKR